jgi:hypothetical protein
MLMSGWNTLYHLSRVGGHRNALRITALGIRVRHESLTLRLEIVQHKIVPRKVNDNLTSM